MVPVVKILSVALMNEPGALAHVVTELAAAGLNIEVFVGDTHAEIGVARLLVNDAEKGYEVLKAAGHPAQLLEAVKVRMKDRPGELARALQALGRARVNIEMVFGSTGGADQGEAIFLVDDPKTARRVLGAD